MQSMTLTYPFPLPLHRLHVQGVNLPLDLMIQLLFFVLLFVGIVLWFKKWEGQTKG